MNTSKEHVNFQDDNRNYKMLLFPINKLMKSKLMTKPKKNEDITRFSVKTQKYYYTLIAKYSNDKKTIETKKRARASIRCQILYEHAKLKQHYITQLRKEKFEKLNLKEIDYCTFEPNTFIGEKGKTKLQKYTIKQNTLKVYERNIRWMKAKKEINIKTKQKYHVNDTYQFIPEIHNMSMEIFNKENNICNNIENSLFIQRQLNARTIKQRNTANHTICKYSVNNNHRRRYSNEDLALFKTLLHQRIINLG